MTGASTAMASTSTEATNSTPSNSTPSNVVQEHPDGAQIRRQVEFYFSDENLPTDLHMLKCCGGRQNLGVSLSLILGFKKMRAFKPRSQVEASLRKSTFLELSKDGRKIWRKVPLAGKCLLDPDFGDDEEIAYARPVPKPAHPIQLIPQDKVQYPDGLTKNMVKPTGFEKTFVEQPLTPQEAAEEEAMYSQEKPFVERAELAIQRFKRKKRMHEMFAHVFNKLMRFGGVESGPRLFQGIAKRDMAEMDAEEITRAMATHTIPNDRSEETQWVVDFVDVCKAFLSSWYPAHYGYKAHLITNACQVPRAFYNYLRCHNVCPEYDDQLVKALGICDVAERELPKVHAAGLALPGDFNKSASVIFSGAQAGMYTGDKSWAEESKKEGIIMEEIGIRDEEAKIKFGTGIAILGSDEQMELLESSGFSGFKVQDRLSSCLKIVSIHLPNDDIKACYAEQSKTYASKLGRLEPLGKLICKTSYTEDCDEYDLPKDNDKYPGGKPNKFGDGKEYEFWIEEDFLEDCFVGMKIDAKILQLSCGLTILDDVVETMCSFFTWIPNELWMERKPKAWRWMDKGLGVDEFDEEVNGKDKQIADKADYDDEFDDE